MQHSSTPWWKTENYRLPEALPEQILGYTGPHGFALVRAWPDGRTDPGWGGDTFVDCYSKGNFNARRVLFGYERDKWAFAIIMRSMRLVCIDIDGKNGGYDSAKKLMFPPTLAETSKSGDGYHLFYDVPDDVWDDELGFAKLGDRIGFEQGVDFRGTGCVYHHKQQLWNDRPVAPLPKHLYERLTQKQQKIAAVHARISSVLESNDDLEVMMMHDEILGRLAKPIPQGKRNNTLFAIGSEMQAAGIPEWDTKLYTRATEVGLDSDEIQKLIDNIGKYAKVAP
jgi:Bifunctional DNA primase/polymerase, N-terminal